MTRLQATLLLTGLLTIGSLTAGCSANTKSFEPTPADEAGSGPGLFSGADGVFSLHGSQKEQDDSQEK